MHIQLREITKSCYIPIRPIRKANSLKLTESPAQTQHHQGYAREHAGLDRPFSLRGHETI